jgi:hypothetical protein
MKINAYYHHDPSVGIQSSWYEFDFGNDPFEDAFDDPDGAQIAREETRAAFRAFLDTFEMDDPPAYILFDDEFSKEPETESDSGPCDIYREYGEDIVGKHGD